jgi:hypothetical protein
MPPTNIPGLASASVTKPSYKKGGGDATPAAVLIESANGGFIVSVMKDGGKSTAPSVCQSWDEAIQAAGQAFGQGGAADAGGADMADADAGGSGMAAGIDSAAAPMPAARPGQKYEEQAPMMPDADQDQQ